jgi:hypothetical protein
MIAHWNRQRMDVILAAGVDLYIKRAWYENTDFFSPAAWKTFIQPQLRLDVELAHQAGAKFGYIITASAMPLLEAIAQTGVDVIIGVDPHAYDLAATKALLGGRVCLWGGVNGHLTVEHGSPADVQREVAHALEILGPDGLILSPVDNVREDTPVAMRNVHTLIETWQAELVRFNHPISGGMMAFGNRKIIDAHIHFPHYSYADDLMAILAGAGIDKLAVVCTPHDQRLSLVPDALLLKGMHPGKVYVFGGLDISPLFMAPEMAGEAFAHYVDVLCALGADGIKMIEGKAGNTQALTHP